MRSLEILAFFQSRPFFIRRIMCRGRSFVAAAIAALALLSTLTFASAQPTGFTLEVQSLVSRYPADYFPTPVRPAVKALSQGDASKALKIIEAGKMKTRRLERLDRVLYLESLAYLQRGDRRQAIQLLDQSLALRSSNSDFLFVQAQLTANPERRLDALTQSIWFNRFVAIEPNQVQLQRAKTMLELGLNSQALNILVSLIAAEPSFIEASLILSELHLKAGRKAEALSVLRAAYTIERDDSRLQLSLARTLLTGASRSADASMINEALSIAEIMARSAGERDPVVSAVYARALIESGMSAKADKIISSALTQGPNDAELLRLRKQLELEMGSSKAVP